VQALIINDGPQNGSMVRYGLRWLWGCIIVAMRDLVTCEHNSLQDPELLCGRSGHGSTPATVNFLWGVGQQRDPCAKFEL
jgi:hypothetical protein